RRGLTKVLKNLLEELRSETLFRPAWRRVPVLGDDMESFFQDLKFALRTLGKNPGFTIVAIITLALGIGANTAIFSLTDQVLLRLLPVERPKELVVLRSPGPSPGRNWNDGPGGTSFSYPAYKDLRDQNQVLAGLIARFST